MRIKIFILFFVLSFSAYAQNGQREAAYLFNKKLGRGINFMGSKINNNYHDIFDFRLIRQNKFTHIRIGSRVWQYTGDAPDYTIDAEKLANYKNAVDWALENDLLVIADPIHAWDDYTDADLPKLIKLWQQIADYFADYPTDKVAFEILNEPRNQNVNISALTNECINVIRNSAGNEERIIIVSGKGFSTRNALINAFNDNVFPADDNYLIGTFHYYDPKTFTKQGHDGYDLAFWADEGDNDPEWDETITKFQEVNDANNNWATANNTEPLPVYLGEYGVDNGAPVDDRIKWLWWIRTISEQNGFSHAIWNLYGNNASSKGLGPWTQTEKDNPELRTLDQNILNKYRNRYEGERAINLNNFFSENIETASDSIVLCSNNGNPEDIFSLQNVFIPRGGNYDATIRFQNNGTDTVIFKVSSILNSDTLDNNVIKLPSSNGNWYSLTFPLFFQTGNNKIVFTLKSNTDIFYFDYLAITKGEYYDNLFPSQHIETGMINVPDTENNKIKIYPNPVYDIFNISGNYEDWEIYDACGQKILYGKQRQVNVSNLSSGFYVLKINNSYKGLIVR